MSTPNTPAEAPTRGVYGELKMSPGTTMSVP